MKIKLSQYAKQNSIHYMTAWRWWKSGKLDGIQMPSGTILINIEEDKNIENIIHKLLLLKNKNEEIIVQLLEVIYSLSKKVYGDKKALKIKQDIINAIS